MTTTETQTKIDELLGQLEAAGKRATPQRYAVCQALVEHGGHPTVADIFERVRSVFPMISQATVYNTIDTLKELGLIHQLDIANHDHAHYDLDLAPHINVVCRYCEYIADVHVESLDHILEQVSELTGCQIDHHALVVYGVCPACRAAGRTMPLTDGHEIACEPGRREGRGMRRGRKRRHQSRWPHPNTTHHAARIGEGYQAKQADQSGNSERSEEP